MTRAAWLLGACALAALAACAAAPEPAPPRPAPQPPSAPSAVARTLEALARFDAERGDVRLRAVHADDLFDRPHADELVRVVLDVSVFAPSLDEAYARFAALADFLARETDDAAPSPPPARRAAAFAGWDWARASDEGAARGHVSYTDEIRLEVRERGRPAAGRDATAAGLSEAALARVRERFPEAPFDADLQVAPAYRGVEDERLRLAPSDRFRPFTRAAIGELCAALESLPGTRVTRLHVEPAAVAGPPRGDAWTFWLELSARVARDAPDA